MFVRMMRVDNLQTYVNMALVCDMVRFEGSNAYTRLSFSDDHAISVLEAPEEIMTLINSVPRGR